MTPTIRDVAERAGVSIATASRALSGARTVTPDNIERVRAAADELGYRRNAVARALRRKVSSTIGMVVPQISNPFFPSIVEAVERQLQESDRELILCDSQQDPSIEARRILALVERQVDGLIVNPCDMVRSAPAVRAAASRLPLVQLDRYVQGNVSDWVGVDDDAGIQMLIAHLVSTGARSFAFVSSKPTNSSAQLRLEAYIRATSRLDSRSAQALLLGEFTMDWGRSAATQLVSGGHLPDAIVCGNDVIALGILRELTIRGVAVPDDVAVTGFDDIGFASVCNPPLTTVRQPAEQFARECVRLLDEQTGRPNPPERRIAIAPSMIVRASTRPCPD